LRYEIAPLFRKSTVIFIDLFCHNLRWICVSGD
jgi:hypothetical protein